MGKCVGHRAFYIYDPYQLVGSIERVADAHLRVVDEERRCQYASGIFPGGFVSGPRIGIARVFDPENLAVQKGRSPITLPGPWFPMGVWRAFYGCQMNLTLFRVPPSDPAST